MHPFPPASELNFLIGLEIGQICLDPWSVQFRFSEGGKITVAGKFEHIDVAGGLHLHHTGGERDTGAVFLRELIQQIVAAIDVQPLRLTLMFSGGSSLIIEATEGMYEDGQIYPPDRPPIVF